MDRLWQMDFYRRIATGRLAEIVGPEGVQIDKYIRTFGVPRMIKHQIKLLSVEDRLLFENYAAGVNKMAENIQQWPAEFTILQKDFEPYTAGDAVAI
jgi:penicillin amidase